MSVAGEPSGPRRVAILAGSGTLPREIALSLLSRGAEVHMVAIEGAADCDLSGISHTWVRLGAVGGMLAAMKRAGACELVIIGGLRRPDLRRLRPDLGFFRHLPSIVALVSAGGDDSVLRRVMALFESQGLEVIGVQAAAPELVAAEGVLGGVVPSAQSRADIARGMEIAGILGVFDVGQAVAVAGGRVLAVEGAEGTDRMLARLQAAGGIGAAGGVLVKRAKPGQERRVDLPAIGPATIGRAASAGLSGIAVEAGAAVTADRAVMLRAADERGLFIVGAEPVGRREPSGGVAPCRWRVAGRRQPHARDTADCDRGACLVAMLAAYECGAVAVVTRRHVLAVAGADETPGVVLARAAGLRQWGDSGRWRRKGVVVVRDVRGDGDVMAAAAAAGLSAVAVIDGAGETLARWADEADRHGLALLVGAAA